MKRDCLMAICLGIAVSAGALWATGAKAENCPERIDAIGYGNDSIEIVAITDHSATLRYTNSYKKSSANANLCLSVDGITVDVSIMIGSENQNNNREIILVYPRGNYVAYPPREEADDGATAEVLVTLPLF